MTSRRYRARDRARGLAASRAPRAFSCVRLGIAFGLGLLAWAPASAPVLAQAIDSGPAESTPSAAPKHTWRFRAAVEAGIGSRDFDVPMDGVVYQTQTGLFPVAGVGVELEHAASESVVLGVHGRYQSSVGLGIVEQHTDGSEHPVDARAHRLEASFVPTFLLDAAGAWALSLHAGYAVLGFRPLSHLFTPQFSLSGPLLRAQLQIPLVRDVLRLRLGPEGQWIAVVGEELEDRGIDSSGVALGGEAALELLLGKGIALHAAYRESWAWLGSSQTQSFKDVARFVTARLTGQL